MNNVEPNAKIAPKPEPVVEDLAPTEDVKGGVLIGLLLPAVQKVREAA